MSVLNIKLEDRKTITSGDLNKLRKEGRIPGVIYGKGIEAEKILVDKKELMKLLYSSLEEHIFFKVNFKGKELYAILQDKQWDVIKQEIMHVDFKVINIDEEIKLYSEFRFLGTPLGVKKGGILEARIKKVKGKGLPMNYPKYIDCDVSNMDMGSVLTIKDVAVPESLKLEISDDTVIVAVTRPKADRGKETASEEASQPAKASASDAKASSDDKTAKK